MKQSKLESQLQKLEAEELLTADDQKAELIRAKEVAKRQADLEKKEIEAINWK